MDEREDRRGAANAQGEGENRCRREDTGRPELSKRVAQIANESAHVKA
jgi:hypothetical protein